MQDILNTIDVLNNNLLPNYSSNIEKGHYIVSSVKNIVNIYRCK